MECNHDTSMQQRVQEKTTYTTREQSEQASESVTKLCINGIGIIAHSHLLRPVAGPEASSPLCMSEHELSFKLRGASRGDQRSGI